MQPLSLVARKNPKFQPYSNFPSRRPGQGKACNGTWNDMFVHLFPDLMHFIIIIFLNNPGTFNKLSILLGYNT